MASAEESVDHPVRREEPVAMEVEEDGVDDDEVEVVRVEKKAIEIHDDDDDNEHMLKDFGQETITIHDKDEESAVVKDGKDQEDTNMVDEEYERRKRRRRRLKRILTADMPSFVAIISPDSDEDNKEEEEASARKLIKIDVNEMLGLKKRASMEDNLHLYKKVSTLPQDEGYFEGIVPLTLKDDTKYLNELHMLIRNQLELYSATDDDVQTQQAGRRYPTVRGKVGVRCIHCAKVVLHQPPTKRIWPSGSVSYPLNIAGLYSVCTQKPTLHFKTCPHMPQDIKSQIYRLTHDAHGNSNRRTTFNNTLRGSNTMTATTYYSVAAKRIGLMDVHGGIRFGRDLSLEPLPVESVRASVEAALGVKRPGISIKAENYQRIKADEHSEKVLAETLAEADSDQIVGRSDDSKLVTDFMFLCIRQMAYCHCCPADFMTKGKKTPMMRLGLTGFCCRHCMNDFNPEHTGQMLDYSCRSFSSAPDNLASAIANSFYSHLQKCHRVSPGLIKALGAFKRVHKAQIAKLPNGSQRRLLQAIWNRLRANDLTEEEMKKKMEEMAKNPPPKPPPVPPPVVPPPVTSAIVPDAAPSSAGNFDGDGEWKGLYPPCDDPGTVLLLKQLEAERDYTKNDGIIRFEDRPITTDYVFVLMKQMKHAVPKPSDFTKGRRVTALNTRQAGFCCRHCDGKENVTGSGRSFPSAPDNMASSLNSSLYTHMQRCAYCPPSVKIALANLKKIHSAQVSNMRFGSQRKYFGRLHERLQQVVVPTFEVPLSKNQIKRDTSSAKRSRSDVVFARVDNEFVYHCGFVTINEELYHCRHCRMVPLALRSRNSIVYGAPTRTFLETHAKECKGDAFDLTNVVSAVSKILAATPAITLDSLLSDEYEEMIRAVVGDDDALVQVFTEGLVDNMRTEVGTTSTRSSKQEDTKATSGYWKNFDLSPDFNRITTAYAKFAEKTGIVTDLRKNFDLIWLFQMISPGFEIPPPGVTSRRSRR